MPIRKKGNIKVKTSPNGYGIERTGYTFYSYDKNSAALVFTFIDSDNAPVNLSKADVQLLLISDNGDEFPVDKDDIDVISAIRGTARYVIPENLLGYEGKITGHIYLDFEDGSHTDEGKFTFNIKRSAITDLASEFGKQYVQDFEDVKERVEQAGDSATKDIEKARDNAESQIGDYVGEVESVKQDISSSASDVQSKANEASEDISNLVKTTEDARDDAVKTMNELDYSDRNLLVSSKLHSYSGYSTQPVVKDNGKEITIKFIENSNSAIVLKINGFKPQNKKYTLSGKIEINGKPITKQMFSVKRLNLYHGKKANERFEVYDDGTLIATETYDPAIDKGYILDTYFDGITDGDIITFYDLQFQRGSVPTPWQPAMGDYDAKIKRLEKAITNLGGSI